MCTVFGEGDGDGEASSLLSGQAKGPVLRACAKAGCSVRYIEVLYSRHGCVGALAASHMLRGVSRIAKLGAHDRLESLDFFAFCGNDEVEECLCSGCEGEGECVAECAVVLGDHEVRC